MDRGLVTSVAHAQRPERDSGDEDEGRRDWRRRRPGGPGEGREGFGRRRGFRDDDDGGDRQRAPEDRDRGSGSGPNPREFAEQFIKARDKNNSMTLEGAELEGVRGREARADANDDKVITVDELVAAISDRNGPSGAAGGASRSNPEQKSSSAGSSAAAKDSRVFLGSAGGAAAAGEKSATKARRTYRFTPAAERLPTGLPSWFKSRDRNKDGQVAMSEYSRTWSARTVNEFKRYDLNNDGVVTPKEAADD
jgi:hypothetical protein